MFLDKISYLAAIGVSAFMSIIYLTQSIISVFVQSMLTHSLYIYPKKEENFHKIATLIFCVSFLLSVIIALSILMFHNSIIDMFKISEQAKIFSYQYIICFLPFLVLFSIEQFFMYILYIYKLAKINFVYICIIVILNTVLNVIFIDILHLGIKFIALSSSISVLLSFPLYLYTIKKNGFNFIFHWTKQQLTDLILGLKKLGMEAFCEPIVFQFIQIFIALMLAHIQQEMLSARINANNIIIVATTVALSISIIIQINVSNMLGNKEHNIVEFYKTYRKLSLILSLVSSLICIIIAFNFVGVFSSNKIVQHYIFICVVFSLFVEPLRTLSIQSKAFLKGMQIANLPLILTIMNKLLFVIPAYYITLSYTNWGIYGVLSIEGCAYFINYILYSIVIKYNINNTNLLRS